MKNILKLAFLSLVAIFTSCSSSEDIETAADDIVAPDTYAFNRDGETTVSFSGQTTRIAMAEEIVAALKDTDFTEEDIDNMFAHIEDEDDFTDTDNLGLNASDKSVRSKVAKSFDYFNTEIATSEAIKSEFDGWISEQVDDVFPNWATVQADSETAGYISNTSSTRYVNANGVELNQLFAKGLIGALMTDQILNNYLSVNVLDAGTNITDNDAGTLEEGKNYTTMEHKWDEAYGYLYGAEVNTAVPVLGADSFLNKYLSRLEDDSDFTGIADDIYNAFKLGRAAIEAKNYDVRDEQVEIIREKISIIIGVRAIYYLQSGKAALEEDTVDYATAFHDLSEGLGFVYSLQFTRNPDTDAPYFTKTEVDDFISDLVDQDGGLWNSNTPTILQSISEEIEAEFDFTIEEASN